MNRPFRAHNGRIQILPIGPIDDEVLARIKAIVRERFALPVEVLQGIEEPHGSFNEARSQYDGSAILGELRACSPDGSVKLLGVIDADLYAVGLNYVFGQAILGGCCGIISLTRLRFGLDGNGDRELFFKRIEKEAVHELGHAFGLRHCPNPRCVMYFSNSIADTDRKSLEFCDECGVPVTSQSDR